MYSVNRILQHINRKDQKPLNIIMDVFDEKYQYILSELHDSKDTYFIIPNRNWNQQIRILPDNFVLLKTDNGRLLLDENIVYDVIIVGNNPSDYIANISTRFNCPIISVYTALPPVEMDSFKISRFAFAYCDRRVYSSECVCRAWMIDSDRYNVKVINRPIDGELYNGYTGKNKNILVIADKTSDQQILKDLEEYEICNPDDPMILRKYQNCQMVINTSWWNEGRPIFEAMSVGCPIITTPCGMLPEIIDHGINGYIAATSEEIRECIKLLTNDSELKTRISEAARNAINSMFDPAIFMDRWGVLLDDCSQSSLGQWT